MVWRMLDATPNEANVMPRVRAHWRPEKKPIPARRYRIARITRIARNNVGNISPKHTYPKHRIIQNPTIPGPSTHLGYHGIANDIPANRSMIPARRAMPPRNVIPSGRGGVGFGTTGLANTGRLIEDLWELKFGFCLSRPSHEKNSRGGFSWAEGFSVMP